jgi:hypothetical protein
MSARQFAAWVAVLFFAVMFKFVSASPDKPGGPQAPQPVALAGPELTAAIALASASAPPPPADKSTASPSQASPSQASPSQASPSQASPSQASPSQASPSQALSTALVRGRNRRADRADEPLTILRHRPPRHDARGTPLRKHNDGRAVVVSPRQ